MAGWGIALPISAESALSDSSKVFDIDEVVVVSQPKEVLRLRQQALSSTSLSSPLMKNLVYLICAISRSLFLILLCPIMVAVFHLLFM